MPHSVIDVVSTTDVFHTIKSNAQVTTLPATHNVLRQDEEGNLQLRYDQDLPSLDDEPDKILVRVAAVGLNPTDYKMPANFPKAGATGGCDFAGTVVQLGHQVQLDNRIHLGDRVSGAVHGSNRADPDTGAFAHFVKVPASMIMRIPDTVSFQQAAALGGVGHGTVAQALWSSLGLTATPERPAVSEEDALPVLVYGGSTATGTIAIQILRLSGLRPIAVCSPHNFALARKYGATAVFDYMSPSCGADIRAHTGNQLWHALDCISDAQSAAICYAALGRAGGHYVCLELQPDSVLAARRAVQPEFLMGYDMFGKGIDLPGAYGREPNPDRHELGKAWYRTMEKLVGDGKIKFHPTTILDGRFDGILKGLASLRKGEVSGTKLVVNMALDDGKRKTRIY
ncbi:chaperonin 10-like protein [Microdochium bolleyi]|uniref:Chaperonin 10-like protein n=1 Tax=Microdochium bolleyi TaxID=196109 RepID=A0A136JCS8_9PEZI|nr:chaperonin 10-like protein [Microdochium bolleyi]